MWKLKLTLTLPPLQLILAWVLLNWKGQYIPYVGNTRALCFAINTPILVLLAPLYYMSPNRWMPPYIWHIPSDNFAVLVAVAVLWCGVGFVLDHVRLKQHSQFSAVAIKLPLAACGLWLFFRVGLDWIFRTNSEGQHARGEIMDGIMAIVWSLILIAPVARTLLDLARSRASNPASP
jgi:hypothetical protein